MSFKSPIDYEFIRIPLPIKKRKDLKQPSKDFYGYLCKCAHLANKDGYIRIKKATVTDRTGMPKSTIKRASEEIVGRGLVLQRKVGRLMEYKLLPIDQNGYPEFIPDYKPAKQKSPVKKAEEKLKGAHTMGPIEKQVESDKGAHTMGHKRGPHHGPDSGPHHGPLQKNAPISIKESTKNHSKEMLPQGISFDSFFDNLPEGIAGKIQRKTVKDFWDKGFEDDLIGLSKSLASSPLDERILIFQGTLKIFDRKLQMKNEQIAIDESNAHKLDFVAAPDRLTGLSSVVGQSI